MTALPGLGAVTPGTLAVLGTSHRVIAAHGPAVAVWDTTQLSRLGSRADATVPANFGGACTGPAASVKPRRGDVALIPYSGQLQVVHPLGGGQELAFGPALSVDLRSYVGRLAWTPGGSRLVALLNTPVVEIRDGTAAHRLLTSWPMDAPTLSWGVTALAAPDEDSLLVVSGIGTLEQRRLDDGRLLRRIDRPAQVTAGSAKLSRSVTASISPDGRRVAIAGEAVAVVDVQSGQTLACVCSFA